MMFRFIYLTPFLIGLLASCQSVNSVDPNKLPFFEIVFGQNIQSIKGIEWPKYSNGKPFELMLIQKPCEILIHLPQGKDLRFKVRNADLKQSHDSLNSVRVRLPIEPVEYEEAISILETEYSRITAVRDKEFASELEDWKTKKPQPGWPETRMSRVMIEGGVKLELGIETVYTQGADRWVSFLQFYLD